MIACPELNGLVSPIVRGGLRGDRALPALFERVFQLSDSFDSVFSRWHVHNVLGGFAFVADHWVEAVKGPEWGDTCSCVNAIVICEFSKG